MALSRTTQTVLQKVATSQSQQPQVPPPPGLTGHASEKAFKGDSSIGGSVDAGSGPMHAVGKAMATMLEWEKKISRPFGQTPCPACGRPSS